MKELSKYLIKTTVATLAGIALADVLYRIMTKGMFSDDI